MNIKVCKTPTDLLVFVNCWENEIMYNKDKKVGNFQDRIEEDAVTDDDDDALVLKVSV